MQVTVSVNGEEHVRDIEPRLLLVHFLRDELGKTGTHWGCDTSNCGTWCAATSRNCTSSFISRSIASDTGPMWFDPSSPKLACRSPES